MPQIINANKVNLDMKIGFQASKMQTWQKLKTLVFGYMPL